MRREATLNCEVRWRCASLSLWEAARNPMRSLPVHRFRFPVALHRGMMPKQSQTWTEGLRLTAVGRKLWLRALPWQCAATNSHTPGFMGATRAACVSPSEEARTITCHKENRIHSQEEPLELHISKKKEAGSRVVANGVLRVFDLSGSEPSRSTEIGDLS